MKVLALFLVLLVTFEVAESQVNSKKKVQGCATKDDLTNLLNKSLGSLLKNISKIILDRTKKQGGSQGVFKGFHAKFTNLGATGRLGPTSLSSHYVGQDHENMVTLQNGIQFWKVPYTGTYEITAVGASGGYDKFGSSAARGRGAYIQGQFALTQEHLIKILVGQAGVKNNASHGSGGGGGSFVATWSNAPLIVAGGGGGSDYLKNRLANCDASTGMSGKQNQCKRRYSCSVWSGGVNGNGALKADRYYSGGGGGGFYSNGRSGTQYGGASGLGGEGGRGFFQGGAGGRGRLNNAHGGFGGGGGDAGAGIYGGAGGGGGGYSGGASGDDETESCGGGGGSYNTGKNQVNKEGFFAVLHGYVAIRRLT